MELLCHFRTTTHATRQLNTQSLKFVHCHTEDFDDEMHKKEAKAERRRGGSEIISVSGFDCDEQQWQQHKLFVCE